MKRFKQIMGNKGLSTVEIILILVVLILCHCFFSLCLFCLLKSKAAKIFAAPKILC